MDAQDLRRIRHESAILKQQEEERRLQENRQKVSEQATAARQRAEAVLNNLDNILAAAASRGQVCEVLLELESPEFDYTRKSVYKWHFCNILCPLKWGYDHSEYNYTVPEFGHPLFAECQRRGLNPHWTFKEPSCSPGRGPYQAFYPAKLSLWVNW